MNILVVVVLVDEHIGGGGFDYYVVMVWMMMMVVVVEPPPVTTNGWPPWNQLPVGGGFGFGDVDDVIDEDDTGKNFNIYLQNRLRRQELPELWIAVPNCCFDHLDFQKT